MYNAFASIFKKKLTKNECVTKQTSTFKQLYAQTTKQQQCVSIVGVKIWNNIDNYITYCEKMYT